MLNAPCDINKKDCMKQSEALTTSNESIMLTAGDASRSKKTAVAKGYWKDDHINAMVPGPIERKTPEINRGYYARTEAVWNIVKNFVSNNSDAQIVSLGCGLDTLYWRLVSSDYHCHKYVEVDFPTLVKKKVHIIQNSVKLDSMLIEKKASTSTPAIHSKYYNLFGCDLKYINLLDSMLQNCDLDFKKPTLFLTECVLMYMKVEVSTKVLSYASEKFQNSVFVSYDALNMNDRFGNTMINNLKQRQCWLEGIQPCSSQDTQRERFSKSGWKFTNVRTMWEIYLKLSNRTNIERLEFLDETELLEQLLNHYCLIVAYNNENNSYLTECFKN